MDNSILALESGKTDARALRSQGAKPGSERESEDFGEVLDDQLLKGEAQAFENQVPVAAEPPVTAAPAAPVLPQVPAVTQFSVALAASELNSLEGSAAPVTLSVNAVDVAPMSQAAAAVPVPQTAIPGLEIEPLTGTLAGTLQAATANQTASEQGPGIVAAVTRAATDSVASAAVTPEQLAGMNGTGLGTDTGAVVLPVATSNQQTSAQAAAGSAAGVRGATTTYEAARPQAEIAVGSSGKYESSEQSLSSTQQITATEAGQSLAERRSGAMSTTAPTPLAPAMAPATQILSPSMQTVVPASVVPQALPALEQPFGGGQWNNSFGQRIAWAVGQGVQSASLALNPAELGPVTVQIAMRDDEASLRFNAAQGLTRDAIEAALPRLREMLQASGLTLGQVDISGDTQARAGQRDTQQQGNGPATDPGRQAEDESARAAPVVEYTSRGLVDTFV